MSEHERLGRVNYNDEQRPDPDRLGTASRKLEGLIVMHFTLLCRLQKSCLQGSYDSVLGDRHEGIKS